MEEKLTLRLQFKELDKNYYRKVRKLVRGYGVKRIASTTFEGSLQGVVDAMHRLIQEEWFVNRSKIVIINVDNANYEVKNKLDVFEQYIIFTGSHTENKEFLKNRLI